MTEVPDSTPAPNIALGKFLQEQASRADLSARDIEAHFRHLADKEESQKGLEADTKPSARSMSFSKSHLDRLYKGSSKLPSKDFLKLFLEFTSRTGNVHPRRHQEFLQHAEGLLRAAIQHHRNGSLPTRTNTQEEPAGTVVTTLRAQVELERSQRAEEKLRWALSDTQSMMGTLLQIIEALRDIITEYDTQVARQIRSAEEIKKDSLAKEQGRRARSYKAAAEEQFDRVNQRRRLLETLWDQAHGNMQRLTSNSKITGISPLPDGEVTLPHEILPQKFLAEPALEYIGIALKRVREHNDAEESTTGELRQAIVESSPLQPSDELAILTSATRLSDLTTRRTALHALVNGWRNHSETRDTLVRLKNDEQFEIRMAVVSHLTEDWGHDPAARDTLITLSGDHYDDVREAAVLGLSDKWKGDKEARDGLVKLTREESPALRENAALGLAEGWPNDPQARDALLSMVRDTNIYVRLTVAESLVHGWRGDSLAHAGLRMMIQDSSPSVKWAAQQGLPEHAESLGVNLHGLPPNSPFLLFARLRPDYNPKHSIPLFEALRRGISFETGITVILGGNGTGKTVLLDALATSAPAVLSDSELDFHRREEIQQIAEHLDVSWNGDREPDGCVHIRNADSILHLDEGGDPRESGGARFMRNWFSRIESSGDSNLLILLDAPAIGADESVMRPIHKHLLKLVDRGCQIIIASTDYRWLAMPGARIVRMDRRNIKKRLL
ncbi:HEAT repeat domain-containing protein [Streptomyces sp. NPDC102340]|uniref:HEAT repeat domain-containing protein n=1 Tax=unclassified Streptomyces TaxID=2593676 RepID=UPI00381BCBAC